jgi:hypothetical protein
MRCHSTGGAATVAAALLLLTGCGGSSSSSSSNSPSSSSSASSSASSSTSSSVTQTSGSTSQFKTGIRPVLTAFKGDSHAIGVALQHASSQTNVQLAGTFDGLAGRWGTTLNQLETLKPPPAFSAAYERLKTQVTKVHSDLSAVASAARGGDVTAAKADVKTLVIDILSAKSTSTTITSELGIK